MARESGSLSRPTRTQPPRLAVERGPVAGDRLAKCLLTDVLGRGAACTVYRALHETLNVPVAVKVLHLDAGVAHRFAHEQLRSEARLLAQLSHPHIVRVLDFEDDMVLPYLILECVEGPSLEELIQQSGRLPLDRAVAIVRHVADALGAVWEKGAVHRDVKPGNILIGKDGLAKLADFGQAVFVERQEIAAPDEEAARADALSGTAAYLAPEQFLTPHAVDHRTDIYALGATFYHAVTGQMPFIGRSRAQVMVKHAKESPRPPRDLVPDLSPAASGLILTLLAKNPDDRCQDADEIIDALERLTGEGGATEPEAVTVTAPTPRRSFWRTLVPSPSSAREAPPPAERQPVEVLKSERPNDVWLDFVKRTLMASASHKRAE